jgi:succinoglycan biosynthesis transport protein ExoP
VQAATVPMESVRPRKVVNLAVGLLLGLVFGTGLALALEAIRRTIRTPRDVVQLLQLPVMGMIPRRM